MSEELVLKFVDPQPMRYGENSHQSEQTSLLQSSSGARNFLSTTSSMLTPPSKWLANSATAMLS